MTEIFGCLDVPAGDSIAGPSAIFQGWAICPGGETIKGMRARVNGKAAFRGVYGSVRIDVGKYLNIGEKGDHSGFWAQVVFTAHNNEVEIDFLIEGKGWVTKFRKRIHCRRLLSPGEVLAWNILSKLPVGRFAERVTARWFPKIYLQRMRQLAANFACWIDLPKLDAKVSPYVRVSGWMVQRAHHGEHPKMRIRLNRRLTVPLASGQPRSDVARALQDQDRPDSRESIFCGEIALFQRNNAFQLEIHSPGQGWVCLRRLTLRCEREMTRMEQREWRRVQRMLPVSLDQHARKAMKRLREGGNTERGTHRARVRACIRRLANFRRAHPNQVYLSSGRHGEFRSIRRRIGAAYVTTDGWFFSPKAAGMRVRVNGKISGGFRWGLRRDYVAAALGHVKGSLHSGFIGLIRVPTGFSHLAVELWTPQEGWIPIRRRIIHCGAQARLVLPSVRTMLKWRQCRSEQNPVQLWYRFWKGWRMDFPKAWKTLNETQQMWLVGQLEKWQLCNIFQLIQYDSQKVRYDIIPSSPPATSLPKITIVTPSYNQACFLKATMESVLSDSRISLDYMVQDGGSTDGSAELIESYALRLKYWESAPDKGQADAVYNGLARADCGPDDVMAYLNSDDTLCPGALWYVANYFARNPDIDVLYGHRIIIDETDREIGRWVSTMPNNEILRHLDVVPQETLFWRRRIYDRIGGIDPSFRFALDWDLLLRFADAGARFVRVPYFLGCFRVHAAQKTSAQISSTGSREMDQLRRRVHGRELEWKDIAPYITMSRVESGLTSLFLRLGWRV